jgi:hypothetical protein
MNHFFTRLCGADGEVMNHFFTSNRTQAHDSQLIISQSRMTSRRAAHKPVIQQKRHRRADMPIAMRLDPGLWIAADALDVHRKKSDRQRRKTHARRKPARGLAGRRHAMDQEAAHRDHADRAEHEVPGLDRKNRRTSRHPQHHIQQNKRPRRAVAAHHQPAQAVQGHTPEHERDRIHAREIRPFRPKREPGVEQGTANKHQHRPDAIDEGPFRMAAQVGPAAAPTVAQALEDAPGPGEEIENIGVGVDLVAEKRLWGRFFTEKIQSVLFCKKLVPEVAALRETQVQPDHDGQDDQRGEQGLKKRAGKAVAEVHCDGDGGLFDQGQNAAEIAGGAGAVEFGKVELGDGAVEVERILTAEPVEKEVGEVVEIHALVGDGEPDHAVAIDADTVADEAVGAALAEIGVDAAVEHEQRAALRGEQRLLTRLAEFLRLEHAGTLCTEHKDAVGFHVEITAAVTQVEVFEDVAVFDVQAAGREVFGKNARIGRETQGAALLFQGEAQRLKIAVGLAVVAFPVEAQLLFGGIDLEDVVGIALVVDGLGREGRTAEAAHWIPTGLNGHQNGCAAQQKGDQRQGDDFATANQSIKRRCNWI